MKPGAGQGSPLPVAPGVCRCSVTSPMMGDTPSGVVAWRTCPSGVASFGRVTHAPADPRALYRAIRRSLLHRLGRRPGAPKWVPGWSRGGGEEGRAAVRQLLDKVVDVPVFVVVSDSVEVPQLQFVGAVQFFDKVADVPVAAAHSSLLGMIVVRQYHRSRRLSCWVSSCSSGS